MARAGLDIGDNDHLTVAKTGVAINRAGLCRRVQAEYVKRCGVETSLF